MTETKNPFKLFFNYLKDREFNKKAALIMLPSIFQQVIFSISGYIDTIMVNRFSPDSFVGVTAANKLIFIMLYFAVGVAVSLSIFVSQYFGANKQEKLKGCIQFGAIIAAVSSVFVFFLLYFLNPFLIKSLLPGTANQAALKEGLNYSFIISFSAFFIVSNLMISIFLKSIDRHKSSIVAGMVSIAVNVVLNRFLIFGLGSIPALGAKGSAIATVVSRLFEFITLLTLAIVFSKGKLFKNIFSQIYFTKHLVKTYFKKGIGIIVAEVSWAICMVAIFFLITQGNPIWIKEMGYAQSIVDLFFIFFSGLASASALLIGSELGRNNLEKAKEAAKKLIAITLFLAVFVVIALVLIAPLFLLILTSPKEVHYLNSYYLILIFAFVFPFYGVNATCYFILRAGGEALDSFLLDQLPTFIITFPSLVLIYFLNSSVFGLGLIAILAISKIGEIAKLGLSYLYVKKGKWVKNLVEEDINF